MSELNYAEPPKKRLLSTWACILIGAVSLPAYCTGLLVGAEVLFSSGRMWPAPALELLLDPLDALYEAARLREQAMMAIAIAYVAIVGGVLGWIIPRLPRPLLTRGGLAVCAAGTLASIICEGYCVRECPTPVWKIHWSWCRAEEAAAIQWLLYAFIFSSFTVFLAILLPRHRRQNKLAGQERAARGTLPANVTAE